MHAEETPPNSPTDPVSEPTVYLQVTQELVDKLQLLVPTKNVVEGSSKVETTQVPASEDLTLEGARTRASRVEYKSVDEVWDKKASSYTISEPVTSRSVDELDQYVFIHRKRIDRQTQDLTSYIDIKSTQLQEVLVKVLKDVRGISIREDKPTIEANLLYSFHREIKICLSRMNDDLACSTSANHLQVLVGFIENTYEATHNRFQSLLRNRHVTYDLLWALFKPNADIYTTCLGTEKAMCVRCSHGAEKTRANGSQYFCVEARRFDYDGKVFGEATIKIVIEKFQGAKRIELLDAFPLQYHRNSEHIRTSLVEFGRRFVSLIGSNHHRQYRGQAFWKDDKGEIRSLFVDGRIVVDAKFFRRINPNYDRAQVDPSSWWDFLTVSDSDGGKEDIKNSEVLPQELEDHDLLICSPTVMGFSLNKKRWLEFAVANVSDIAWNQSSFDHLAIPAEKKKVIRIVSKAFLAQDPDSGFDDVIQGKGRGLVSLLHGPPGVGKTLTAEALSEHLRRPLYAISAGELGVTSEHVEKTLSDVFDIASHWRAVLLLDEADVFVEQRSTSEAARNALVCVFLRSLEYYEGILFLTTNRVKTIDEAIASRIHLPLRYIGLNESAQKKVWQGFLEKASAANTAAPLAVKDLGHLAKKRLNGRQIKNAVLVAQAMADDVKSPLQLSHLEEAIEINDQFQSDFRGAGQLESVHSYF